MKPVAALVDLAVLELIKTFLLLNLLSILKILIIKFQSVKFNFFKAAAIENILLLTALPMLVASSISAFILKLIADLGIDGAIALLGS